MSGDTLCLQKRRNQVKNSSDTHHYCNRHRHCHSLLSLSPSSPGDSFETKWHPLIYEHKIDIIAVLFPMAIPPGSLTTSFTLIAVRPVAFSLDAILLQRGKCLDWWKISKQIANVDKIIYLYRLSSRCNDWGPQLTRDYISKNICSKIENLTPTGVMVEITFTTKMMTENRVGSLSCNP